MKLEWTRTLINTDSKACANGDYYSFPKCLRDALETAELARVTLTDGAIHWAAPANFTGGTCECCAAFALADIAQVEIFQITTDGQK